jgi:hypothetical protein
MMRMKMKQINDLFSEMLRTLKKELINQFFKNKTLLYERMFPGS